MPSAISHHKKTNLVRFHFRELPGIVKFREIDRRPGVNKGQDDGELLMRPAVGDDERILDVARGVGCPTM